MQPKLHFYILMEWQLKVSYLLRAFMKGLLCHISPDIGGFLKAKRHHMNNMAKFHCHLGTDPGHLESQICISFCLLFQPRNRKCLGLCPFTSWKITWAGPCPEDILLLIPMQTPPLLNFLTSFSTIPGCNIKFLGALFLFKLSNLSLFLPHLLLYSL